jgi:hypothetical protein
MKTNIVIISFLILLGSCKQKEIRTTNRVIDSKSIINNDLYLSKLCRLSNLIPLETNENSLISSINKMYFVNEYICILDREGGKGVFLFDQYGKFIRKIGKIGKGPGEYISIDDFTIDKNNSLVYLLTNRKNILLYDINGKYIRSFDIDFYASKIEYNNASKRIYFVGDDLGDNLIIADLNCKKIKGFFPNKNMGKHVRILNNPFTNLDTIVLYRRFLDDNIYTLKGDSLYIHCKVDFGDDAISKTKLEEILKLGSKQFKSELQKFKCHIKFYVENNKNILMYFYYNKIPHICIYRKDNHKSETYSMFRLQDDILYSGSFPLIENITNENEFVFIAEPESMIKNIANIKNDSIKNAINVMIEKSGIKIDSNPIICVLKNKSDE